MPKLSPQIEKRIINAMVHMLDNLLKDKIISADMQGDAFVDRPTINALVMMVSFTNPTNANHEQFKKYFPNVQELKGITWHDGGMLNDVPWWSLNDSNQETLAKRAIRVRNKR